MELKLMCILIFFLAMVLNHVGAGFFYNTRPLGENELGDRGLKCIPGRTLLKFDKKQEGAITNFEDDSEQETRREHMKQKSTDPTCRVCVCSTDGKDEYCSNRQARNLNECIVSAKATQSLMRTPYDHNMVLAHRIRRLGEYIWHKDEIPYEPHAKCKRGFSYYSNSVTANDTDIDVGSDVDSLLSYQNADVCHFCICSVSGREVGCIARDPWVCEYYRAGRDVQNFGRNLYTTLFQQDRPAYFRQLSFRLRRNMDMSITEYLEIGGDTLCCSHPDGHRRKLQAEVRNRVRQLRRKTPRENLMSGGPGGDYVDFIVNNDK